MSTPSTPPTLPGPPLLADVADVRRYLATAGTVSAGAAVDEDLLQLMLEAASDRLIDAAPDRTLLPIDPASYTFPASPVIRVPDLRRVDTLEIDGTAQTAGGYGYTLAGRPGQPALWVHLGRGHYGRQVTITGAWGPEAVKPAVREAATVWVARVYHQRSSRFADNVAPTPDGGTYGYFRNLPPDVKLVLEGLEVPGL